MDLTVLFPLFLFVSLLLTPTLVLIALIRKLFLRSETIFGLTFDFDQFWQLGDRSMMFSMQYKLTFTHRNYFCMSAFRVYFKEDTCANRGVKLSFVPLNFTLVSLNCNHIKPFLQLALASSIYLEPFMIVVKAWILLGKWEDLLRHWLSDDYFRLLPELFLLILFKSFFILLA